MTAHPRALTGPHLITTTPSLTTCRHCHRPMLAVTVGGLDRHIDPTPLTDAGELAALLAGRATYNLGGPMADHLIRRTVHHIRGGRRQQPVVAGHHCAAPELAHVDRAHLDRAAGLVRRLDGQALEEAITDVPPF